MRPANAREPYGRAPPVRLAPGEELLRPKASLGLAIPEPRLPAGVQSFRLAGLCRSHLSGLRSAVHLSRGGMVPSYGLRPSSARLALDSLIRRMYRGWGGAASRVAPLERAGKDGSTGVRSRIESRGINVDCLAPGEVLCARQHLAGVVLSRDILLAGGAPQAWRRVRAEHRCCVHGGAARLSPRHGVAPGSGPSLIGVLPRWVREGVELDGGSGCLEGRLWLLTHGALQRRPGVGLLTASAA